MTAIVDRNSKMHLHRTETYRIALILAIMAITCGISWASTQCKTVVMDVMHMKMCKLGAGRAKRGMERLDLQKYDEKYGSKRQEGPDYSYSKVNDSTFHGTPQKRHLSTGQVGDTALPIMVEAINGAVKDRVYAASRTGYYGPNPSSIGPTFVWPGYYPSAPYPLSRGITPFRAPTFNNALGFELNDEELDQLYNDIYERLPRASKEQASKVFLETASKCCQNVDMCLKRCTYLA